MIIYVLAANSGPATLLLCDALFLFRQEADKTWCILSFGVVCAHEFTLRTPTDLQDSSKLNKKAVWLLGLQHVILEWIQCQPRLKYNHILSIVDARETLTLSFLRAVSQAVRAVTRFDLCSYN